MPADPQRIQSLFLAAIQAADPITRAALLDRECGDDTELRQRVEVLLQAHDQSGSFLDKPAVEPVTTDAAAGQWIDRDAPLALAEKPGMRVGRYKLLQQIGEGGMGVVYMAEQQEPVRRMVALKIIKPGMDSDAVLARFEAERQALALMEHQNIARVFDGGATESGRPFFVMELVKGIPITRFCDENRLTPRERLELFVAVCAAVQHAHQKGVIHRDLKPSNVLVTLYDGKPVPKVIDFGVAKALHQKLTERTMFTAFGAVVGTLEYMSPEQAEMNALDVDTRSDVYSLGVLLYELLTGTTPLERERLRKAAYTEMLRLLREEEPPRPSLRISGSGQALARISAQRKTEPAQLARLVRGELDWIAMKSLEKDRSRRYETASSLARDVERYLKDEPVEACPPSVGYRLGKFARKYQVMLSTAAAIAAVLLIASGVSIWLAVVATRAKQEADDKRKEADENATRADFNAGMAAGLNARNEQLLAEANANAAETGRALDRMTVAKGIELAEKSDLFSALSWFVKPLDRGGLTKQEELIHRVRIACYLRHTPGRPILRQMLFADGPVSQVAWSADAKRVFTVSGKVVRIWDVQTGESLTNLTHPEDVSTAQFMPGDARVLTVSGKVVRIWDVRTGETLVVLTHPENVGAQLTPDGARVLTDSGTTVWQWDVHTGRQLGQPFVDWEAYLQHPLAMLPRTPLQLLGNLATQEPLNISRSHESWLEISEDASRVLSGNRRVLRLVDLASRKLIAHWLRGKEDKINDHALSPDGQRLLLIRDGRASGHDTAANDPAGQPIELGECVHAAFNRDGSIAYTITRNGSIQFWDAKTWKAQKRMSYPSLGHFSGAEFSPDDRFVFCGGQRVNIENSSLDDSVDLWEAETGGLVLSLKNRGQYYQGLNWTPDGRQFLSVSQYGGVELWDVSQPAKMAAILPHGSPLRLAVYGPDARMLLTAAENGEIRIWDLGRGNERFTLKQPAADAFDSRIQILTLSYIGGGSSSWAEQKVTLDNAYMKRLARVLPLGTRFSHAAVSPDRARVLTSLTHSEADATSYELQLWDAHSKRRVGKPLQTRSPFYFNCAAFDPTSRFVVVGCSDGTHLLDARTGEVMGRVLQQGGWVVYAAFSPDGERLVTCGTDNSARLWQTRTGQPIGERLRHDETVALAAFSTDGRTLATASLTGKVYLWDDRGGFLGILTSKRGQVRSLLFHPSGLLLVAFFNDKMRLWDVTAQQEISPELEGRCDVMTGMQADVPVFHRYGEMKNPGFDLPGESAKASDFIKLSQLYSERRPDAKGDTVLLSKDEREALWRELRVKYPAEFAVVPTTAVEWRIGQIRALIQANRLKSLAFHRRWLASELAESGWQSSAWTEEDIKRELVEHQKLGQMLGVGFQGRNFFGFYPHDADVNALHFPKLSLIPLHALALHGRHAAATTAADAIALHFSKNATILYSCACVHALAAGAVKGDTALTERYATRAVALLRQSAGEGYYEPRQMIEDSDLDSLRQRDDFQMFLKKLKTKRP